MSTPAYFRKQAITCLKLAAETSDEQTAQRLRVMAADFSAKAEELERDGNTIEIPAVVREDVTKRS